MKKSRRSLHRRVTTLFPITRPIFSKQCAVESRLSRTKSLATMRRSAVIWPITPISTRLWRFGARGEKKTKKGDLFEGDLGKGHGHKCWGRRPQRCCPGERGGARAVPHAK